MKPKIKFPSLLEVLSKAFTFSCATQLDAQSFFFQVSLHPLIQRFFPFKVCGSKLLMKVLAQGWNCAPGVACTVSEIFLKPFCVFVTIWVDDFLCMDTSTSSLCTMLGHIVQRAREWGLVLKDVTPTISHLVDFIGVSFDLTLRRWRLDPKWVSKATFRLE